VDMVAVQEVKVDQESKGKIKNASYKARIFCLYIV
jgi:hypothetical protein